MTTALLTYTLSTNPSPLTIGSSGGLTIHAVYDGDGTADITQIEIYVPLSTDGTQTNSLGYSNSAPALDCPDGWSGSWFANAATFVPSGGTATVGQTILDFTISGLALNPNPASCDLVVTESSVVNYTPTAASVQLPVTTTDGSYTPPAITTSLGKIPPGTAGTINWNGNAAYGYLLGPSDMLASDTGGTFTNNDSVTTADLLSPCTYTLAVTDSTDPTGSVTYTYDVTVDVAAPVVTSFTVNGSDSGASVDIDDYVTLEWTTQNADRVTIYMDGVGHTIANASSYRVQIDRPRSFQITASYGDAVTLDPPQDSNESHLFPQSALQVTPTDPAITKFEVANDKLFADSTVYFNWSTTNANKIRLQNALGAVIDYTPNITDYNAGKPTLAPLATGTNSPLNYTLSAWYEASTNRVLVWGNTEATYADEDASTTNLAITAVATDDAEVPQPNAQASLALTYQASEVQFKTFTYTGSYSDMALTVPGKASRWKVGVAGFSMQLSSTSSHDLHDIISNAYSYDQSYANGQTSGTFSAQFYMKDDNGHENSSDACMRFVMFYCSSSATNYLLGSGTYDGTYAMSSTSSAKSYTTGSAMSPGGNPVRTPTDVRPFVTRIGVYYPGGDEELSRLVIDAQSSASRTSDTSSTFTVSGYSTAFGDKTFSTFNPGTGIIGTFGDAGCGYGIAYLSEGTASATFDFEVEDAVTVLNKYDGSTTSDQNIYKIQSDRVTCTVDQTNTCKVNLTWGNAYWQDKSHQVDVSRKIVVFAKYKVPTAS